MKLTPSFAVTIEMIDPSTAQKILEKSTFGNRRLRAATVTKYAAEMRQGQWKLTPEPLVITREGNLIQGHHRLNAVVQTGMTVPFVVFRDWEDESVVAKLDSGIKRSVADAYVIEHGGNAANANLIASIARVLAAHDTADAEQSIMTRSGRLTRSEQQAALEREIDAISWSISMASRFRAKSCPQVSNTAFGAACVLLARGNAQEVVEMFFSDIAQGRILMHDPRWALLRWNPTVKKSGMAQNIRSVAAILKVWNAYVQGREIKALGYRDNETFPVPLVLETDESEMRAAIPVSTATAESA